LFKGSEKYAQLAAPLQRKKLLEEGIYKRYLVIVSKTKNKVPTVATEEHFLLLEFGFLLKIQHELILLSPLIMKVGRDNTQKTREERRYEYRYFFCFRVAVVVF